MRNFLLHLAQRSVGKAPLIQARAAPALDATGAAAPAVEAAAAPSYPRTAFVADMTAPLPPRPIQSFAGEPASPAPVDRPIAEAQPISRPDPAPRRTPETSEDSAPPIPHRPIDLETGSVRPAAEAVPTAELAFQPAPPERTVIIHTAAAAPPVIQPAAIPDADAGATGTLPAPEPAAPSDRRDLAASIAPRDPEPGRRDVREPRLSDISLKPANLARRPIARLEPMPPKAVAPATQQPQENRLVHVRIGAIEIHGAAPPAAAAPAPAAAPAQRAALANGFDGFSRLRSYAPWEW
jgi:hypothetical protein